MLTFRQSARDGMEQIPHKLHISKHLLGTDRRGGALVEELQRFFPASFRALDLHGGPPQNVEPDYEQSAMSTVWRSACPFATALVGGGSGANDFPQIFPVRVLP